MPELDDATRQALSRRYGPTPDAKARILTELRASLGPGGPSGGDPPPEGPPPASAEQLTEPLAEQLPEQLAWIAKIVAATAGLTGAGLLVVKLGATALAGTGGEPSPRPELAAAAEASTLASEPREPTGDSTPPVATPAVEPAVEPAPDDPPATRELARRPAPRATTGSDLAAELALLEAAEQLRASDPTAALARLDHHARQFPAGSLAPEREVLRVELLCALGRRDRAARVAASVLASHAAPQLRARVEASCVGTGSTSTGD